MIELRLDHQSPIPLRAQVEQLLLKLVEDPDYQDGRLLPDELTLARRLGVSRTTIRAGMARLVHVGLVERKPGIGTRVSAKHTQSGIGQWHSFTHEMEQRGITVQTFELSACEEAVDETVARALEIEPGARVVRLDRLRGWDATPAVHFTSWLHPRLGLREDQDYTRPLYELIEETADVSVDQSHEEMLAVAADERIARLLHVNVGAPLLQRRRTVYDPGRKPVEFAIVHYRSDRFTLTLDIRREPN